MRRWLQQPEGSNWGDFAEDDQISDAGNLSACHNNRFRELMPWHRAGNWRTLAEEGALNAADTRPRDLDERTGVTPVLLPEGSGERRMALGVAYDVHAAVDPEALAVTLVNGIRQCLSDEADATAPMMRSMTAI